MSTSSEATSVELDNDVAVIIDECHSKAFQAEVYAAAEREIDIIFWKGLLWIYSEAALFCYGRYRESFVKYDTL